VFKHAKARFMKYAKIAWIGDFSFNAAKVERKMLV